MLRSLLLIVVYLTFLGLGLGAPFVLTLGYVWVDTFQPQYVAYFVLNQLPVSMIMGAASVLAYVALDRRSPPRLNLVSVLQVLMGIWVTLTLIWAEAPALAWDKWDWAFKTIMFSAFVPLVIRSRVQIEAFAQIYVFALAANFIPFGVKTLISGGGYGVNLGLQGGNTGLSEGGLLSTLCLMIVPLALFLGRHGQLLPRHKLMPLAYLGIAGLAVATALGTYERSALIGLVVLAAYMFMRSQHKIRFGLVLAVLGIVGIYATSSHWTARISTIGEYNEESSALVRILVWRWTLGYASGHPFGGGFSSFVIDHIELPGGEILFSRAFHSIYFEVLGEQGWVGLGMFLTIAGSTIFGLRRVAKRTRNVPHLAWCAEMSDALQSGLMVFLSAGAFVGIAFQPMFWYFIAMSISLRQYVGRVEREHAVKPTVTGRWQGRAAAAVMGGPAWQPNRLVPPEGVRPRPH
ncbi:MAG: putative O-glycosylation ligase, exosortase A system-associated [Acetobacteraceae bacterium]|nr:putative O-glycosylation ligase, exosortase A system-associated [Acetobacteraceae bacterium]